MDDQITFELTTEETAEWREIIAYLPTDPVRSAQEMLEFNRRVLGRRNYDISLDSVGNGAVSMPGSLVNLVSARVRKSIT